MSDIYGQLRKLIAKYDDCQISIDDFRADFAGLYFQARQASGDIRANSLASRIVGPLAEFSRHHRDEHSLRQEMAAAIGLLEWPTQQFAFAANDSGGPLPIPVAGNSSHFNVAA